MEVNNVDTPEVIFVFLSASCGGAIRGAARGGGGAVYYLQAGSFAAVLERKAEESGHCFIVL